METNSTTLFTQKYYISATNINPSHRFGLSDLLKIIQDITISHADSITAEAEADIGADDNNAYRINNYLMLKQQKLSMRRWPNWGEALSLQTWVTDVSEAYTVREYAIFIDEEQVGSSTTLWTAVSSRTELSQPTSSAECPSFEACPIEYQAGRINRPKNLQAIRTVTASTCDLGINRHIDNIHYVQWILNCLPVDFYRQFVINSYEIDFLDKTVLGDKVICTSNINQVNVETGTEIYFEGKNSNDGESVFVARIIPQRLAATPVATTPVAAEKSLLFQENNRRLPLKPFSSTLTTSSDLAEAEEDCLAKILARCEEIATLFPRFAI